MLHGPAPVAHGTKDELVNRDYSQRAAEGYASVERHMIEGGTHGSPGKHDAKTIGT